jgi:hypothetical protein
MIKETHLCCSNFGTVLCWENNAVMSSNIKYTTQVMNKSCAPCIGERNHDVLHCYEFVKFCIFLRKRHVELFGCTYYEKWKHFIIYSICKRFSVYFGKFFKIIYILKENNFMSKDHCHVLPQYIYNIGLQLF